MNRRLRGVLLRIHLWAGLIAAAFLLILGVTGSLMVFEEEIDHALNPRLTWVHPAGRKIPLAEVTAALEKAYPGRRVRGFEIPAREDMAWWAFLQGRGVAFNPYNGQVLGTDADRNDFAGRLHDFHLRLALGRNGQVIVGWAGPFLLLLSITGLVLWWPRKILRPRAGKRLSFELHNAVGFWSSAFLMLFALTAIVIHWEGRAALIVDGLTHSPAPPPFPRSRPLERGRIPLDADRLLAIATAAVPGARPTFIELMTNPVRIAMKYPEDRTPAGRTNLFLDAYTGQLVFLLSSRTGPLGFRVVKLWNREIHTGDIFGWPTRILAALLSLLLPVMAITGPLIWWRRRQSSAKIRS